MSAKLVDKWVSTLRNSNEETSKRYKALVSIKKYSKEQSDDVIYHQMINENHQSIFTIVTEKMSRFLDPPHYFINTT